MKYYIIIITVVFSFCACKTKESKKEISNRISVSSIDYKDCRLAFGLKEAIYCASFANEISAFNEEWPDETNSTLFFSLIKNNQILQSINFCFVHLDSLPKSIGELHTIEKLQFSSNNITRIPKEIGELKNLKELIFGTSKDECGGNEIERLPKEIGNCESLEKLGLAFSRISDLPDELKNCERLKVVDLYHNEGISLLKLRELKKKFPNIQFISHLE